MVDSLEEIQLQASGDRTFIKKKKEEVMAPFANPCRLLYINTLWLLLDTDSWSGILRSVGASDGPCLTSTQSLKLNQHCRSMHSYLLQFVCFFRLRHSRCPLHRTGYNTFQPLSLAFAQIAITDAINSVLLQRPEILPHPSKIATQHAAHHPYPKIPPCSEFALRVQIDASKPTTQSPQPSPSEPQLFPPRQDRATVIWQLHTWEKVRDEPNNAHRFSPMHI